MQLAYVEPGVGFSSSSPWIVFLIWAALLVVLLLVVGTLLLQSLRSALGRIRADR